MSRVEVECVSLKGTKSLLAITQWTKSPKK